MAFKLIAFATLVAAANAGFLPAAAPLPYAAHLSHSLPLVKTVVAKPIDTEYDHHPQYSYGYDVHDTLTGDAKNQQETRDGDVVKGSYSLIEADGTRRVVKYTADPIHGFNAVVHKEPATLAVKAIAPAHVAHVAPLNYAHAPAHTYAHAPAHTYVQAPVHTYAHAPAHTYVQAPVHTYAHAPAHTYAVPVAKYTPASLASHVSYSAPAAAYVH